MTLIPIEHLENAEGLVEQAPDVQLSDDRWKVDMIRRRLHRRSGELFAAGRDDAAHAVREIAEKIDEYVANA
jgi:hypothetical protein